MAGYSGTPLIKKLGIKPSMGVAFINAPRQYKSLLGKLPSGINVNPKNQPVDFIHYFGERKKDLLSEFPIMKRRLKKDGSLWISWPKKSSNIETDLTDSTVRKIGLQCGLVDVKVCAVDEDWSGLKFVYRLKDR